MIKDVQDTAVSFYKDEDDLRQEAFINTDKHEQSDSDVEQSEQVWRDKADTLKRTDLEWNSAE